MASQSVRSEVETTASADQVWALVRDFCAPWHPAITSMARDTTPRGGLLRRFEVAGDTTKYVERLTWFSAHERTMSYTHVAGIEGVTTYDANLKVTPTPKGSRIVLSAEISAPEPRLQEIADGTRSIFDEGLKALANAALQGRSAPESIMAVSAVSLQHIKLHEAPKLALTSAGEPGDTLCLFLHGIGGGRTNWDRQVEVIGPLCQAASLDLRGYGDSALGADQTIIDDYCDDILRVMAAFNVEKLVLCGLSYGAWIATSFAMRHPEKLAALVVSGGCTGMSEAGQTERDAFRQSREVPMSKGQTPADFAPAVVNVIAGPDANTDVREALRASMAAIPASTYADALRCFTNPTEVFDFGKLSMPVLLMTGEHDRLAPPTEIRNVAQRIFSHASTPDVRFEVIKDAGHVCNVEQPAAYNAVLRDFIGRILPE